MSQTLTLKSYLDCSSVARGAEKRPYTYHIIILGSAGFKHVEFGVTIGRV